jgi:single-strand DNA-binding protein
VPWATTIVGNLVDDSEFRFTNSGIAVANMRVAVTQRIQQDGEWRDGDTSFLRVNVWRGQAEHLADSLTKGDRVMVTGRLRQRIWETPEGDKRSVTELEADEVGASLKWATAKVERSSQRGNGQSDRSSSAPADPGRWTMRERIRSGVIVIRTVRVMRSSWSSEDSQLMSCARVTVVVRRIPLVPAPSGTRVARPASTTMACILSATAPARPLGRPVFGDRLPRWQGLVAQQSGRWSLAREAAEGVLPLVEAVQVLKGLWSADDIGERGKEGEPLVTVLLCALQVRREVPAVGALPGREEGDELRQGFLS